MTNQIAQNQCYVLTIASNPDIVGDFVYNSVKFDHKTVHKGKQPSHPSSVKTTCLVGQVSHVMCSNNNLMVHQL